MEKDILLSFTTPQGEVLDYLINKDKCQAEMSFKRLVHLCFWNRWDREALLKDMENAGVSVVDFMREFDSGKEVSEILKLETK